MSCRLDVDGAELERFRDYLMLLSRLQLGPQMRGRLEASDLVQQTLLDACRDLEAFRGSTDEELAAWLRRMLACNLVDARRALGREKRDINRERPLQQLEDSCSRLEACLEAVQTSPSGRAVRNEQLLLLAAALQQLPVAQREAIELHYLQEMSLARTAAALNRSQASVAGLLRRGLRGLRRMLDESRSSGDDGHD
jgi:RNA polymerase sigma-70 factor, ECF subfamily